MRRCRRVRVRERRQRGVQLAGGRVGGRRRQCAGIQGARCQRNQQSTAANSSDITHGPVGRRLARQSHWRPADARPTTGAATVRPPGSVSSLVGRFVYSSIVACRVETIRIPRAEGCERPGGANVRDDGYHLLVM